MSAKGCTNENEELMKTKTKGPNGQVNTITIIPLSFVNLIIVKVNL